MGGSRMPLIVNVWLKCEGTRNTNILILNIASIIITDNLWIFVVRKLIVLRVIFYSADGTNWRIMAFTDYA
jgi:hypothetical protein